MSTDGQQGQKKRTDQLHNTTAKLFQSYKNQRGHCGHDCMVVGFTTTYAISAYHHYSCEFKSHSWRGVQHYV